MATPVIETDDRKLPMQQILDKRGLSLTEELLDIQQHAQDVDKAQAWAENPLCLLLQAPSDTTFKVIRNGELSEAFVAVSWTRQPSSHESITSGKYSIKHSYPIVRVEKLQVRNCILDRLVKYLLYHGLEVFWLDKACINQQDEEEKEAAIDSMDLIYQKATRSIALLSTPIETRAQLRILNRLIRGSYVNADKSHTLRGSISHGAVMKVIRLLRRLTQDVWWTRAWTFQEEYVSGLRMDLLFPLGEGLEHDCGSENIPGEYCVQATRFREQATIFLSACLRCVRKRKVRIVSSWYRYQRICNKILETVAKYTHLLSKPMSAQIFADVGRRSITKPWDSLAITANACGYQTRLDRPALLRKGQSLSLCLLAQFLLNGEVTLTTWQDSIFLHQPIFKFLESIIMTPPRLPMLSRQLTIWKSFRLPGVEFSGEGMSTHGYLWHLRPEHAVSTSRILLPEMPASRLCYLQSHPWETQELEALVLQLEHAHRPVAIPLRRYMERRRSGHIWPGNEYMDIMAWDLAQAVAQGYVLRIGYLDDGRGGSLFIPECEDIRRPMSVFTTWKVGEKSEYGLDNYVCVKVEVQQNGSLRPVKWIRGLAFFTGIEWRSVVLGWFP